MMYARCRLSRDALFLWYLFVTHCVFRGLCACQDVAGSGQSHAMGSYMLVLNCYLDPTAAAEAASRLQHQRHLWSRGLSGGAKVHVHAPRAPAGVWNDFLLMDAYTRSCEKPPGRYLRSGWIGMSFILPGVGRITVTQVVEDTLMSNKLAQSSPLQTADDAQSRWRYPRRYLKLPAELHWTGRGVRVALLDNGVDTLFTQMPNSQDFHGGDPAVESRPSVSCWSFVPGTPCTNDHDPHGTFSVSLISGNVSLTDNHRHGREFQGGGFSSAGAAGGPIGLSDPYVGVAPGSIVGMFRAFDDRRASKTSWVLAALNAALQWRADVVGLAFGGDDHMDAAFVEKIRELAAAGVVVVAATGNTGPSLGSIHNPADQAEVLAVGSLGTLNHYIASGIDNCQQGNNSGDGGPYHYEKADRRWVSHFSGRGPSTWEFPFGAGRLRPDVVALGEYVVGLGRAAGASPTDAKGLLELQVSHGTSVATPLVVGVVALCIEALRSLNKTRNINIALIKRIMIETAVELTPNVESINIVEDVLRKERSKRAAQSEWSWLDRVKAFLNKEQGCSGDGTDMVETLLHYRSVLQYSRLSQGGGEVCPMCALSWIERWSQEGFPTLSVFAFPGVIDATSEHHLSKVPSRLGEMFGLGPCFINWPYCEQPLFPSATPVAFNVSLYLSPCEAARMKESVVNVSFAGAKGLCSDSRRCKQTDMNATVARQLLYVRADASPVILAHTGWLSIFAFSPPNASNVRVDLPSPVSDLDPPTDLALEQHDIIVVSGSVSLSYVCSSNREEMEREENGSTSSDGGFVTLPFRFSLVRRPPRAKRVGFDVVHQWFYPPAHMPGDDVHRDVLPRSSHHGQQAYWRGGSSLFGHGRCGVSECESDHLHTNMVLLYLYFRRVMKLFVEQPLLTPTSHDLYTVHEDTGNEEGATRRAFTAPALKRYYRDIGILILFDLELPLLEAERTLIADAVRHGGLHLLVIGEWYHSDIAKKLLSDYSISNNSSNLFHPQVRENAQPYGRPDEEEGDVRRPDGEHISLDGAFHAPSLNALLHEITDGALQLDLSHVVSGELFLKSCQDSFTRSSSLTDSLIALWNFLLLRVGVGDGDGCSRRHLGEIKSAGTIQWPPKGYPKGPSGRRAVICGPPLDEVGGLYLLTVPNDVSSTARSAGAANYHNGASLERSEYIWTPVTRSAFVPLFGFVGSRGDCLKEGHFTHGAACSGSDSSSGSFSEDDGTGVQGRVVLFTDSDGFCAFPFYSSAFRSLTRLIFDVTTRLEQRYDVVSAMDTAVVGISSLVDELSREPSVSLPLMGNFIRFLHTGNTGDFMEGSDCRRTDGDGESRERDGTSKEGAKGSDPPTKAKRTNKGRRFESFTSHLLSAAPQRVEIAKRVRAMVADWEAINAAEVVLVKHADKSFLGHYSNLHTPRLKDFTRRYRGNEYEIEGGAIVSYCLILQVIVLTFVVAHVVRDLQHCWMG